MSYRRLVSVRIGKLILLLLAPSLVAILESGCYRRVVNAKGPAAENYDIYEPNLKDEDVDKSIWNQRSTSSTKKK